ncbi:MAG: tetratricopeptide repeat protein [Ferruginibacter sp.]
MKTRHTARFQYTGWQLFILLLLSFFLAAHCLAQADSNLYKKQQADMMKKVMANQQQAMEQLKKMGINIDPNKKMSKAEVMRMKEQLISKSKEMQQQMQTRLQPPAKKNQPADFKVKEAITKESILNIAGRFYKRSYTKLTVVEKSRFDQDMKSAVKDTFSSEAVRKLSAIGGALITFGNEHHIACVYLAAAVKSKPGDTLCVNNFGAYLRAIDSVAVSVPVLLYANKIYAQSPVILTQLGNSYFELHDFVKAEKYYKEALQYNPGFGQAHSSLCELYIQQNRLKDALVELFAGVKNIGCSYSSAAANFNYLQQQAEAADTKESFWNETKNNIRPEDALAPLVPDDNKIKMPDFPTISVLADWMEGGGYAAAVKAYKSYMDVNTAFVESFVKIHKEVPQLPPNVVLRDFPNERMALDCITEFFHWQSSEEFKKYDKKLDDIKSQMFEVMQVYMKKHELYVKNFITCSNDCGTDQACIAECRRVFCVNDCPAANECNQQLQSLYLKFPQAFTETKKNQEKILDDLYAFTGQWYSKIESPYWSRIYAYEIRRVALTILGNTYAAYPQAFLFPVHNDCGTDCSVYVNPAPTEPGPTEKKNPKGAECGLPGKIKFSVAICELGLDCESVEIGCTEIISTSVKRNFVKKTTTAFLGLGVKGDAGIISAGAKAGVQVTVSDNMEVDDVGFKSEMSVSAGWGPAKASASSAVSYTVMTGLSAKPSGSIGVKLE